MSGDKDASEFVLALATGGVIHPTGYPIYTVLGHAFALLLHRLGASFPYAANAWAALGGGVAVLLYHRLALRLLPAGTGLSRADRFALAALPVLLLGFNPVWMVECTTVEVHSWHLAWLCGTVLYFVGLVDDLGRGGALVPHLPRRMVAWGLLCGLGGAHHTTAIFFVAGLTLALCWALSRARQFRAWIPAAWLAAGALPLLGYGYIYYRVSHPGDAQVWPMLEPSFQGTFEHVTARAYRFFLGRFAPDGAQAAWLVRYIQPFLWPGLVLFAFHGARARGFAARLVAGALLLAALGQTLFAFQYGVGDPNAYFLPPLLVALLSVAVVGGRILPALKRLRFGPAVAAAGTALVLLAFIVPSLRVGWGRKQALVDFDRSIHSYWSPIPYERAIVLWPDDLYYRLKEYQVIRGEKPHLDVYNTGALFNERPRRLFQQRHGFDPQGALDEAHRRQPLKPEFVIGQQRTAGDTHAFAVVHEHIAQRAAVPVIAFDPPNPLRTWLPRAATPTAIPPRTAAADPSAAPGRR